MSHNPNGRPLRIGMVGYAFMGAIHSHAWRAAPRFFDLPSVPEMRALAGRNLEAATVAAERMGWASVEPDWRRLIERDDIDPIDICSPADTHARIAEGLPYAPGSTCCAKSRWRTRSKRPRR